MNRGWWDRPIGVFDVETTGTDPLEARMVSAAFAMLDPLAAAPISGWSFVVNPGIPVPLDAAAVHGITTERAELEGVHPTNVLIYLCRSLTALQRQGLPLVIFNVRYDWTLLHAECARFGLTVPAGVQLLDPTIIDRTLDKWRRGSRKLADVCSCYQVPLTQAHAASADAEASGRLMYALAKRYPAELQRSLAELQIRQRDWFTTWKLGINEYWSTSGKDQRVEGDWPLIQRVVIAA